jgi:Xaa-Pro aminopeptidase
MHAEQRRLASALLEDRAITHALFAHAGSVRWLTGFSEPIQLGPSLFAGGPSLVWYAQGQFTLIVLDSYEAAARDCGCPVVTYRGYSIEEPPSGATQLAVVLREVIQGEAIVPGKVGIEERDLPVSLWSVLRATYGSGAFAAIDGVLVPLQMVKTEEELAKLRENFALTDIGHAAARRAVRAGVREIDVWTEIASAIERAAGKRVALGNDCVVGYRQNNIGGWPGDLEIRPRDSVIVDLSTLVHGYWSDSCATYYAGEPTPRQRKMHETAAQALTLGISLVRPGVVARDVDRSIRQFMADAGYPVYPHHTGHGVGLTGHVEPRIVPYNAQTLEAGMVIMLEPGIYFPGETAVRLEDALLVTEDGAEVLTHHDKSIP